MATWHQQQAEKRGAIRLYHPTQWTVVIDPPNQMRALMRFTSRDLAEVYMRNLKDNNPGAYAHSYILKPTIAKGLGQR
jgi:hypothetical protein